MATMKQVREIEVAVANRKYDEANELIASAFQGNPQALNWHAFVYEHRNQPNKRVEMVLESEVALDTP